MAQHSGFFNALNSEGSYDRRYNADDYTSNLAAIISTGVRRSGDNELQVTASGLTLTVNSGRAWIDGRWYYNDTPLSIATVTPPTGTLSRRDGVYLHADSNLSVRNINLVYRTGTPSAAPTAPACIRDGGIYEIMLASVLVAPGAETVTVIDKRSDASVCGWITSPIGYEDYFENLDEAFEEWFTGVKDTLSSVTLFKQYIWSSTLSAATDTVTFNIPQYDPTGVDIIQVYVNGLLELEGSDYTLSSSTITFDLSKVAGTEINVICYKSIDGTGLGDVSDEITELQNEVAALGNIGQFYYFGTGTDDNIRLSMAIADIFSGATGKSANIRVVGDFGATRAVLGSGTAASPYKWFDLNIGTENKLVLDFENAGRINIQPANDTYNVIFDGQNFEIIGAHITAGSTTQTALVIHGDDAAGFARYRECVGNITGSSASEVIDFTGIGDLTGCDIIVTNQLGDAAVINGKGKSRVFGGRLRAFTGDSAKSASALFIAGGQTGAGISAHGVILGTASAPTGRYQTGAADIGSGTLTAVGCITSLAMSASSLGTVNEIGTLPS